MASELYVYGPLDIVYTEGKAARHITTEDKSAFVAKMEEHGIAEKHGCYVFALRTSKGYMPWYVGKAARPLSHECMGSHQLNRYQQIFAMGMKGTPVLFFVCPEGTKKKVGKYVVDEVETELIQHAARKNPDLLNIQKRDEIEWCIRGILHGNGKKLSAEEADFKAMMGIATPRRSKAVSQVESGDASQVSDGTSGPAAGSPPLSAS